MTVPLPPLRKVSSPLINMRVQPAQQFTGPIAMVSAFRARYGPGENIGIGIYGSRSMPLMELFVLELLTHSKTLDEANNMEFVPNYHSIIEPELAALIHIKDYPKLRTNCFVFPDKTGELYVNLSLGYYASTYTREELRTELRAYFDKCFKRFEDDTWKIKYSYNLRNGQINGGDKVKLSRYDLYDIEQLLHKGHGVPLDPFTQEYMGQLQDEFFEKCHHWNNENVKEIERLYNEIVELAKLCDKDA